MVFGEPIFEIAIYRKSPTALEREDDEALEKLIHSLEPHYPLRKLDRNENQALSCLKKEFWEKHGEPYPYNQVIGWVTLFAMKDQILVEYYKTTAKRLTRNCRRHRFKYRGYFAIPLVGNESTKEIVTEIVDELRSLSDEGLFSGRYVDTRAFMRLAPYIKWKKLIRESS